MTDAQARKILELRVKGEGYKSIATVVSLSRDIVRNYCKAHNLTGYASALKMNIQMKMEAGDACIYCGADLIKPATGRPKKFCSDKCRREWWKAHPELINRGPAAFYELTCVQCHKKFISYGNKNRKYCSRECYFKQRFWEE